jgi:hypothetical protein
MYENIALIAGIFGGTVIAAVGIYHKVTVAKLEERFREDNDQMMSILCTLLVRDALKKGCGKIVIGEPSDDHPRTPYIEAEDAEPDPQHEELLRELEERNKVIDSSLLELMTMDKKVDPTILAEHEDDGDRLHELTVPPFVSHTINEEVPVWFWTGEEWSGQSPIPAHIVSFELARAFRKLCQTLPQKKTVGRPEYIRVPGEDGIDEFVRVQLVLEQNYCFSIELFESVKVRAKGKQKKLR